MHRRYAPAACARFAISALSLLFSACGGQARDPAADAGAGANASGGACAGVRIAQAHRALAQACPTARGSVEPIDMAICTDRSGVKCTKDADCTAGKNGRCSLPHGEPCDTECTYDECQTDADCARSPCVCRASAADTLQNVCLPGSNCKTDSDCGNCGYCSLSATLIGHDCRVTSATYTCHTASDECIDDTDCMDGGLNYCAYDEAGAARWACGSCFPYPVP